MFRKFTYLVDTSARNIAGWSAESLLLPKKNFEIGRLTSGYSASPEEKGRSYEVIAENEPGPVVPPATVAVSLYNYRRYIVECLESVKHQTMSEIDLVVVDDCSTDGSAEVVHKWLIENGSRFGRYLLIRHKSNEGVSSVRNTAFALARTKYVFVLDADNQLYPRCLERLVSALDNCDASFAYCYIEIFGERWERYYPQCLLNVKPWDPGTLKSGNTIDAMVLLRKSVWEKVGGYSTNEVMRLGWEDYELWFKVARINGWGILVPEIMARYRVHSTSLLRTTTNVHVDKLWAYLQSNYPEFFS